MTAQSHNIVIATGIYPPDIGGPSTYVTALVERFVKAGHGVKIITFTDQEDSVEHADKSEIIRISRQRSMIGRYWKMFRVLWRERRWATLFYAHDLISVGFPSALVRLCTTRLRLVIRLGGDFLWEQAYNRGWTTQTLTGYYTTAKSIREKVYLALYRFVLGQCDRIIFSTQWQARLYQKVHRVSEERVQVIANPFPTVQPTQSHHPSDEPFSILFAGRLIPLKNVDRLISAVGAVPGATLTLVGHGPSRSQLQRRVVEQGIGERVSIRHAVPHAELLQLIQDHHCVVVPSISEVSPNLVLECIALGVPVIVTKECGFVDEFSQLIFVDPMSTEEITAAIKKLTDTKTYTEYRQQLQTINTSRNWDMVAKEHLELFARCV